MARKTKEAAEQTREALLDAAELAFREHGVSRTSLDQIARRAGCTRGAVYWHFRNKYDLFRAIVERTESPLIERFERAVADRADPVEALRTQALASLDDIASNPHTRNVLEILFHRCEFVDELAPALAHHQAQLAHVVARSTDAFARAQALGQIDATLDPRLCAQMFHVLMTGLIRDWLLVADAMPLQATAQAMFDHLLASYGHRPSQRRSRG